MNHRLRPGTTTHPQRTVDTRQGLLGIYLNDHLAGATAGAERARYLARASRGTAIASAVGPVATEIAEDRETLLGLMRRLDVPARRYKIYAGWAAEKAGRLKSNGSLVRRSPLSSLIELEVLRVGVAGKVAAWQALRRLADTEDRLDPHLLDNLLDRAHRQLRILEELHSQQVRTVFRTHERPTAGAR